MIKSIVLLVFVLPLACIGCLVACIWVALQTGFQAGLIFANNISNGLAVTVEKWNAQKDKKS